MKYPYLLTTETRDDYFNFIGALVLKDHIVTIYKLRNDMEVKQFKDGCLCADLAEVFSIIEKIIRFNRSKNNG